MGAGAGLRAGTWAALALAGGLCATEAVAAARDDADAPAPKVWDVGAQAAIAAGLKSHRQALVLTRFAVLSERAGAASESCRGAVSASRPANAAQPLPPLDVKVLDALSAQLKKRLARKVSVIQAPSPAQAGPNAVVLLGCVTRYEAGDAAKRVLGLHMGASRLAAHVRLVQKGRGGLKPVMEYDVAVTGGSLLPPLSPIGAALHVATMNRRTLIGDAGKLGNRTAYALEDALFPGEE